MKHSILNKTITKTAKKDIQENKNKKDKTPSPHEISQLMNFTNKIEPSSGGLHWTTVTSSHF